jgi:hypothetical protein
MSSLKTSFCSHAPDASGMLGLYAVKESLVPIACYFQSVEIGVDRCSQRPVRVEAAYSSSPGSQIVFAESAEALCTERGPQFGAVCQVVLLNKSEPVLTFSPVNWYTSLPEAWHRARSIQRGTFSVKCSRFTDSAIFCLAFACSFRRSLGCITC